MIVGLLLCSFNGGMYILFSPAFNLGEFLRDKRMCTCMSAAHLSFYHLDCAHQHKSCITPAQLFGIHCSHIVPFADAYCFCDRSRVDNWSLQGRDATGPVPQCKAQQFGMHFLVRQPKTA